MMRVLVCGGRKFGFYSRDELRLLMRRLNDLDDLNPLTIIEGGAPGADTQAWFWAEMAGAAPLTFPADWNARGRAAGPIRNQQMIDEGKPDLVLAFPGGDGTSDMVRRALLAGVQVEHVR